MEQMPKQTEQLAGMVAEQIERSWQSLDLGALLQALAAAAPLLAEAFIAIGDEAAAALEAERESPLTEADELRWNAITFEWSAQAKGFLLLWRDVLFELQRARLLLADGVVAEGRVERLRERSRQTLLGAANELIELLQASRQTPKGKASLKKKLLRKWRLQTNPWPTYREQLGQVPGQCRDLLETHRVLMEASAAFRHIEEAVRQMETGCRSELEATEAMIGRAIGLIEREMEQAPAQRLGKLAALLEDLEGEHLLPHHLNTFLLQLEAQIDRLPEKLSVAVAIDGGILERKEVLLRRRVQQWMESEILPLLYESWEVTESVYNGLKMTLVNIRNRALLLSAGSREGKAPDFDPADLSQPLQAQRGVDKHAAASLDELFALLEGRLEESFRLSLIYDTTSYFLPVPLQSTINQLQFNQNKWLVKGRRWLLRQRLALRRLRRSVEQEERMSVSEKVVRYINHWKGDPDNQHYASIFLTRGYIGESFAVGRRDELEHVGSLFRQWNDGFRGAIAITGQRFSGKSLFGELVANRFFPDNAVRLVAGETVEVQGRKHQAGYDLRDTLEFIRKYTLNVRPLIWLDDLELWWDAGIPLYQNVRALMKFIDNYSNNIFFVVSMSNSLKAHLEVFAGMGDSFQANLNMDYMTAGEIREAILMRHGATHQKLVDAEGQEVTPQQFRKMTQQVHRSARGNIGDALVRWAGATHRVDEERVVNAFSSNYGLPDFLTPESAMILASIMLQKRTNEYRLRKLFGPAFAEKYRSTVQRLLNVGILQRQLDGWLEINELVVSDLGYLLERKKHLRYRGR